jgi:hypothetical protein
MTKLFIWIGSAVLALTTAASAQTIPTYPTEAHCRKVADIEGTFSLGAYRGCMLVEQSAKGDIIRRWASVPGTLQQQCDKTASDSYANMRACIRTMLDPPPAAGTARSPSDPPIEIIQGPSSGCGAVYWTYRTQCEIEEMQRRNNDAAVDITRKRLELQQERIR